MNSKNESDFIDNDGWICRKVKTGLISGLLGGNSYMSNTMTVSPSGKYAAFVRFRILTVNDKMKNTFRRRRNYQRTFNNKLYIFDFSTMSLDQYKLEDDSTMQVISFFYWLNDESMIIVTQNESSYTQKQYLIQHKTRTIKLVNEYEHAVAGHSALMNWFTIRHRKMHPIDIQGKQFIFMRRETTGWSVFCLLPYYISECGPKYPVIRLQFIDIGNNAIQSILSEPYFALDGKIYFASQNEDRIVQRGTYICYDLNNIDLTKTDVNYMRNGSVLHQKPLEPHSFWPLSRLKYDKIQNVVTIHEIHYVPGQNARIWIWNVDDNTMKECPVKIPHDCEAVHNLNGILYAVIYPSWNSKQDVLKVKILPGGSETIPKLKDLCTARILQSKGLLKKSGDLNHILFK